jgi:hypothetical protein
MMDTTDHLDQTEVDDWTQAGQLLIDRARTLAPSNAGVKEMSAALRQARTQLPRVSRIYASRCVTIADRRVVNGIVVERPTTRREAGDELCRRALRGFRNGGFSTIGQALRAVMQDDPVLTKIYVADGSP